jgi:hypothetical protein
VASWDRQTGSLGLLSAQSELPANHLTQCVRDLPMAWHWSAPPVCGIAVDIVPPAMPYQLAPGLLQLPDERLALHTSSSTGCRWAAGGAGGRSWVTIRS